MYIISLKGGLGNQMFQYAAGRSLQIISGSQVKFLREGSFGLAPHSSVLLENIFDLKLEFATQDDLRACLGKLRYFPVRRIISKKKIRQISPRNWFFEKKFSFDDEFFSIKEPAYLVGYWQAEKYFYLIKNIIRDELKFKVEVDPVDEWIINEMCSHSSVSVHIRRGDYLKGKNQRIFNVCDTKYYGSAKAFITEQIRNPKFFIFADDLHWARQAIAPLYENCIVVEHNNAEFGYKDMWLMSRAKHNIISNSSFAWWAAWLNNNVSKRVIAPKKWFVNGNDESTLVPEGWVRL